MTQLVGILNLTPDSFSDGGQVTDIAVRVKALVKAGAHIIDIGAESTRPGATPLSAEEEWARLVPFFTTVFPRVRRHALFSLDTRHPTNAQRALAQGIHWINDVSGFADPAMRAAVRDCDCRLVMMHSLSVPADPTQVLDAGIDPITEIIGWARTRIAELNAFGIASTRLILDPGIGFGKTAAQSLDILTRVHELRVLHLPLLIGHSRKSCLASLGNDRDAATLSVSESLASHGIEFLRIHDVAAHTALLQKMESAHG